MKLAGVDIPKWNVNYYKHQNTNSKSQIILKSQLPNFKTL